MQVPTVEERHGQVFGAEGLAGAAVGDHGPLPRPVHEHEDLSGAERWVPSQVRPHPGLLKFCGQGLAYDVVADPTDEFRSDSKRGEPGGGVRARAAGDGVDGSEGIGAEGDGALDPREQVIDQVSEYDDPGGSHRPVPSSAECATAMRAARAALRRMISLLTLRLSPFVSVAKWPNRNGVTSLPRTPRRRSSSRPARNTRSWSSGSSCSSSGRGLATTSPDRSKPSPGRARITCAFSSSLLTAQSRGLPESVR